MKEVDIGPLEELPVGSFKVVQIEGREIGVVRMEDDRVHAVLNHCPHRGSPVCLGRVGGTMLPVGPESLEYGMESRVLTCPWHGWEFDLETGQTLWSISRSRLRTYPVSVRNGRVVVTVKRGREEEVEKT